MVLTMIRKTKQSFYRTIFNKKKLNEQFQERTKNSNFAVNIFQLNFSKMKYDINSKSKY